MSPLRLNIVSGHLVLRALQEATFLTTDWRLPAVSLTDDLFHFHKNVSEYDSPLCLSFQQLCRGGAVSAAANEDQTSRREAHITTSASFSLNRITGRVKRSPSSNLSPRHPFQWTGGAEM